MYRSPTALEMFFYLYTLPLHTILKKYELAKLKVYRTDLDGTVTIISDGKTYTIVKEK